MVHFNHYTDFIEDAAVCPNGQNPPYVFDIFTPTGVTDPQGLLTTFTMEQIPGTYDLNEKRLKTVTDPSGQTLSFIYNSSGYLTQVTASDGQSVTYTPYYGVQSSVTYSDNTSAFYTYGSVTTRPDDTGLTRTYAVAQTAQDTRAEGPMQSIQYAYNLSPAPKFGGEIASEKHYPDGIPVSTFTSDDARTTATDTRGDGPSRTLFMSKNPNQKTPLLRWKKDFDGVPEYFYYNGYNYLSSFVDRNGNTTLYTNEAILGRPTTITHPAGTFADGTAFGATTTTYTYSNKGVVSTTDPYFVASVKDDRGYYTYYDRDTLNRITQIRYPDGATETFVYNTLTRVTRHKRKNDYYEFADYDTTGKLLTLWAPVLSSTNPQTQAKTTFGYYPAGHAWATRLNWVTDPFGSYNGDIYHSTFYEYDLSFDANGVQTTTPCPGRGLVTKVKNPVTSGTFGAFKTFGYDKYGNNLWEENELRQRTTYTYDDYKRVFSAKLPPSAQVANALTSYDYTRPGYSAYTHTTSNWQKMTQLAAPAAAVVTQRLYDANLRKSTEIEAYGVAGVAATTYYDYDANGNETKMTDPRGTGLGDANHTVTTTYDSRNRKTRVTNPPVVPVAAPTDYKYDANGNVTSVKRADSTTETKAYDTMNRLVTDTVPKTASPLVNIVTQLQYFPSGALKQVTDGNLNVTSFLYNGYDLRTTMTYPDLSTQTWTYDDNNNVLQWKNTLGIFQTFTYDRRNRKLSMQWLTSAGAQVGWVTGVDASTYTYDDASRMTIAENQVSKVTRTYDEAGRLLADTQDIKAGTFPSHTVNYTYRADGKVTDIKLDTAQDYEFLFGYDGMARLETIKYVLDTSTDYQYYYDLASNVTKRFNWVDSGTNVVLTYDNLNRVSERDINVPTTQIPRGWFSKEHYTYDAMNRLTKVLRDEDAKSDIFTYYLDGELLTATYGTLPKVTYNLDNAGNRTSVLNGISAGTYVPNNLNQYTTVAGNSALYANAHALSSYLGENYSYIGGTYLAKATVGTNTLLLYYDALGRCVQRPVNGVTKYRIFDGDHFIMEYNSSNANIGNALYGRGIDELIARSNNNQGQFSFPDRNGNVSVVLGFLGETLESYRYDVFGVPTFYSGAGTLLTQTGISNALLYTGREWDQTFGLYEYRARGYDPKLGRFLSEDPKGFDAGDYNLYRYVANDPLDKTDPMGLDAEFTLMRDPYDAGANPRLSAGTMRITENGRFVAAIRVNENGFYPKRQGVPPGKYVVLPKREDGASFKKGTPAVTSPERKSEPGATTAGHEEGMVLIHGEGPKGQQDSRACITCNPAGLKTVNEVFNRNKDSTTLEVHNGPKTQNGEPEIRKAIPIVFQKEGN